MRDGLRTRRRFLNHLGAAALALGAWVGGSREAKGQSRAGAGRGRRKAYGLRGNRLVSRGVRFGELVHVSGVVGGDVKGRIDPHFDLQAMQTMLNLQEAVERCGSALTKVLKCHCYLTRAGDLAEFNDVYAKFFPEAPPARTCVVVQSLTTTGALVEVDCVCHV